jgi:hypothetical protein
MIAGLRVLAARLKGLFGKPIGGRHFDDDMRGANSLGAMETLWRDVRYGARQLSLNPLFTTVAVLSLALGIGANTAIFTLLDQLGLRLLPVQDPERLVMIWSTSPHIGNNAGPRAASYPMYQDFQRRAEAFEYVFCRFENAVFHHCGRQHGTYPRGTGFGQFLSGSEHRASSGTRVLTG